MTASEFAFLALGLILGVASGAALSIVIRARPSAPREVRVTVTPGAIPRRSSATLSGVGVPVAMVAPARGGPADPANLADPPTQVGAPDAGGLGPDGTPVRFGVSSTVASDGDLSGTRTNWASDPRRPLVGVLGPRPDAAGRADDERLAAVGARLRHEVSEGHGASLETTLAALDRPADPVAGAATTGSAESRPGASAGSAGPERTLAGGDPGDPGGPGGPGPASPAGGPGTLDATAGPCAEERRHAEERCALADRLREEAVASVARRREAQRAYDDHLVRGERASEAADPRAVRATKEAAWAVFRQANAAAHGHDDVEAAAREWLHEIDRINRAAREAAAAAVAEREAANALVAVIDRLGLEADGARINAESAEEACIVAREALAACEEAELDRQAGRVPVAPGGESGDWAGRPRLVGGPDLEPAELAFDEDAPHRVFGDREPAILKLLRGDREAMGRVVAGLAGDDPDLRRHWQLQLSGLVDAIVARAIAASALVFPQEHPFWGPFTQVQSRDIATALASLGYRFDGLGGFADERVPSQRDLSLAIGYAGLDPMRTRHWPNEHEMPELYREVTVAADEYLAATAGELGLGEMVATLGGRAEELTDTWNAWAHVRPLLLQP